MKLFAGIDPNVSTKYEFDDAVDRHKEFLDSEISHLQGIKINLGFFLRFGSAGIQSLESFVARYRQKTSILLDAKFGEISNTLEAYLDFAYGHLGVHGLTLNPFLGENTLITALNKSPPNSTSYILAATSEFGQGPLKVFSKEWKSVLACIHEVQKDKSVFGMVVGANRTEILDELQKMKCALPILAPGLGAQGASWETIKYASTLDITFPISRGIFEGGLIPVSQMRENFKKIKKNFEVAQ